MVIVYPLWKLFWNREKCYTDRLLDLQYIPRNMHSVFALLCFVVVIHWLIFPYPSGLLHWHCGNLTIAPVPAKQPWWIWINFLWIHYERLHNHNKASTTKPCAYFLGYTVVRKTVRLQKDFLAWLPTCGWLFSNVIYNCYCGNQESNGAVDKLCAKW